MGKAKSPRARTLRPYETLGGENRMVAVNYTLWFHPAFATLSPKQKELYMCMASSRFNLSREEKEYIQSVYPDDNDSLIYFNEGRWLKGKVKENARKYYNFELYTNRNQFYLDKAALIEHGLIEVAESNRHARSKNLYRLSEKWKCWEET